MPAPVLGAIFAPTVAGGLVLSKKAKAKRAQAAANKWSTQFPLVDDYASNQAMILKANEQLKVISASKPKGMTKAKWRAEISELSKWIGVMKGHSKDLQTGLDMASTNVTTAPTPMEVAQTPLPIPATPQEAMPSESALQAGAIEGATQVGDNLAAPTKKGTNWLLIGGVVVGAIVLFRLIKK